MVASTAGIIDSKSPLYQFISTNLLPCSLFLLLISVDIKAIMRLGKPALIMFFAGSFGVILGAPLVFFVFKNLVGQDMWAGFACLSASWTGGSANFIAVKEALNTPDHVLLPMIIVDTIVPYIWMGTLVALVKFQPQYDAWNKSDRKILDELNLKISKNSSLAKTSLHFGKAFFIIFLAVVGSMVSFFMAKMLPEVKNIISTYAWTIIIVSMLAIVLSLTPARHVERYGSTKIGYFFLYFVLTSIGARANLSSIHSALILILAGILLVLFHFCILILTSRMIKAPFFLIAVASQANIGGVASAPVVAEIYQSGLASVGLLLAILGNIVGTYFGILAGQLCRWIAGS